MPPCDCCDTLRRLTDAHPPALMVRTNPHWSSGLPEFFFLLRIIILYFLPACSVFYFFVVVLLRGHEFVAVCGFSWVSSDSVD